MHYSQSPPLAEALDLDAMSDQRIGKRPVKPFPPASRMIRSRATGRRLAGECSAPLPDFLSRFSSVLAGRFPGSPTVIQQERW